KQISVVDTPGILDTNTPDDIIVEEIVRCIQVSSPGPHAFILVLQLGRFTREERNAVQALQELFGEQAGRFMIVLFTRGDQLQGQSIDDYVQTCHSDLRELIMKCGGRYHVFNNKNMKNRAQVMELLDLIDKMMAVNEAEHYTQEMYEEAEEKIREKEALLFQQYVQKIKTEEEKKKLEEMAKAKGDRTRKAFKSVLSSKSVTTYCKKKHLITDDKYISVVDTPGLFDTEKPDENTVKEITKCIQMSCPGPHAFLLVMQLTRFTDEEKRSVEALQEIFGEKASKYMIVLFTRGDDLEGKTIHNFMQEAHPELKKLIWKCGGRYHVFNNKDKDNKTQVKDLLAMIECMMRVNGGSYYTQEMYQEAEAKIREKEKEILEQRKREVMEKEKQQRKNYEDLQGTDQERRIPRVIGAIDCTHISIRAPLGEHEGDYVNRKSFHGISVHIFDHIVFDLTCRLACIILSLKLLLIFKTIKDTLGGEP
ncbi:GIMA4 GTPase, partial [Amia calva]|nr:GIMA4 GTPase [Amia calva]